MECNKRLSERLLNVFLKKLDVSKQRILYLKQTDFDDKQQDDKNTWFWQAAGI